jgi:hypothetical protein
LAWSTTISLALSVREIPPIVLPHVEREHHRVLAPTGAEAGLFIRYLRYKPGRGLCIVYAVDAVNASAAPRRPRARRTSGLDRWVTVTMSELTPRANVTVQRFPHDSRLPALAESCAPVPGSAAFSALEGAARTCLSDNSWNVISATAEPVRYKPASRCVIRYRLVLQRATRDGRQQHNTTLFGKLYRHPEQAIAVHSTMQGLYAEQEQTDQPVIPRPLAIAEMLGLSLNEAVPPIAGAQLGASRGGLCVMRPRFVRGRGGRILEPIIPDEELRLTATALARLHTSHVQPAGAPRTGATEAQRVIERAALIAARNPAQAQVVQRWGNHLARRLEQLRPSVYGPAHGGFKASQLLFGHQQVFVMDLDGFCAADPALDVGYFLAYLRPSALWYGRAGMRQWYEEAAARFIEAYARGSSQRGVDDVVLWGILERTRFYEAALLFKIATRRVNRLNSPRPGELSAMLAEIARLIG